MTTATRTAPSPVIRGLRATAPQRLPFAPSLEVRAFLLERPSGSLLVYSTGGLGDEVEELQALGGASRQYLNHWHEAGFGLAPPELGARLVHHRADAPALAERGIQGLSFDRRYVLDDDFEVIPTPGHTPGATVYLWDTGETRVLFTGDTVYLRDGKWVAAVLESSDRASYLESLELIRELEFDVLAPWAASACAPFLARVDAAERRERIDALIERVRGGEES